MVEDFVTHVVRNLIVCAVHTRIYVTHRWRNNLGWDLRQNRAFRFLTHIAPKIDFFSLVKHYSIRNRPYWEPGRIISKSWSRWSASRDNFRIFNDKKCYFGDSDWYCSYWFSNPCSLGVVLFCSFCSRLDSGRDGIKIQIYKHKRSRRTWSKFTIKSSMGKHNYHFYCILAWLMSR